MTELVSPCCGKPVTVAGMGKPHVIADDPGAYRVGGTLYYECSACGKPCDPVPAIAGPCDSVHPSDAHVAEVQKSRDEWEKP